MSSDRLLKIQEVSEIDRVEVVMAVAGRKILRLSLEDRVCLKRGQLSVPPIGRGHGGR